MGHSQFDDAIRERAAWNAGKKVGTKRPFTQKQIWVSYAFAFSSLTYHFFPLLLERGLDSAGAVLVLTVIGPAQVAGRILIRAFAAEAPVRSVGSVVVVVFPLAVIGFGFAPPEVLVIAGVAAFYGAANGMITIVRGMAVPEMRDR